MDIYLSNSRTGRLADKRIRIFREENPRRLSDAMDLVFTNEKIENPNAITFTVHGYNDSYKFKTNDERLSEYFDRDRSHWTKEAIETIAAEEKELWEAYMCGDVFGIACERWNAAEREWTAVENTLYGVYGAKDAIAIAKDILLRHSTEAFVVTCEEDVKYCFNIKKDGCDDKNV